MAVLKKVLVFGTFDRLHDGHRFFLREARTFGDRLIAAVARDEVVHAIKKHRPAQRLKVRVQNLAASGLVDEVVLGDRALGSWSTVKQLSPDIIAIGYDQTKLEQRLREYIQKEDQQIGLVKIGALEPDRLHSRLLRKKKRKNEHR